MAHITLTGYSSSTRHRLLSNELAAKIGAHFPERIQLRPEWTLKYSLEQHGASLSTFYEHAAKGAHDHQQRGYVLIIKDQKSGIFGAYSNVPLVPVPKGMYQGNSDCFLWKVDKHSGEVSAFTYTGSNDYLVFCNPSYLSFGSADGHSGLYVDQALENGSSEPSSTFGNDVLSTQGERFNIVAVELWEI